VKSPLQVGICLPYFVSNSFIIVPALAMIKRGEAYFSFQSRTKSLSVLSTGPLSLTML
jgi:hypothetical protein